MHALRVCVTSDTPGLESCVPLAVMRLVVQGVRHNMTVSSVQIASSSRACWLRNSSCASSRLAGRSDGACRKPNQAGMMVLLCLTAQHAMRCLCSAFTSTGQPGYGCVAADPVLSCTDLCFLLLRVASAVGGSVAYKLCKAGNEHCTMGCRAAVWHCLQMAGSCSTSARLLLKPCCGAEGTLELLPC